MSAPPKLKSALKKSSIPSSSKAGPSKSSAASSSSKPSANKGKAKSKHSVTLATKAQRFKGSDLESESEGNASGFEDQDEDDEGDIDMDNEQEIDTDEEIEKSKEGKEKKPTKRKRPATTASTFGETLATLLADPMVTKSKSKKAKTDSSLDKQKISVKSVTSKDQAPILALSAHKPPTKSSVSIEAKARRQLKVDKEEKEDQARVTDVVEGWAYGDGVIGGQEFERGLRKTAQRGVIKLFNAILLASKNSEAATTSLSAQAKLKPEGPKSKKEKDNILGRGGKEDVLTKESFLDMVRKGSSR
ncbi:uncharacterized protein IL334_003049 [Kwoniella shivajii]|uniref:Rrp15p-domain-containing protein n=1 Tax=Kwoniella shivajii TaxID=564305 RepID=A0ABZ1CZG2_9TREE|nr:hypothetical protein IL334_003049 [Kwoniella shivajii]